MIRMSSKNTKRNVGIVALVVVVLAAVAGGYYFTTMNNSTSQSMSATSVMSRVVVDVISVIGDDFNNHDRNLHGVSNVFCSRIPTNDARLASWSGGHVSRPVTSEMDGYVQPAIPCSYHKLQSHW